MSEEEAIKILKDETDYLCEDKDKAIETLLDLYKQEKEKNKILFEEYNKRVGTIIKYEQGIKSFFDETHITDIEPWSEYKIKGELLFELEELLEEN